jgi:uncharacterized membrane protein (UPF0127 family)
MRYAAIYNLSRRTVVADQVAVADGMWARLRGLIGRPAPRMGEGLLLRPCSAIHMWGMRTPLDAMFLDSDGQVVAVYPRLAPGSHTGWHPAARTCVEMACGSIGASATSVGDRMAVRLMPSLEGGLRP